MENTETINVSPLGISFPLRHLVVIDDIVQLNLPMPAQLRLFDFEQSDYLIYGQVRRVRSRPDGATLVGVAFISKEAPEIEVSSPTIEPLPQTPRNYHTKPKLDLPLPVTAPISQVVTPPTTAISPPVDAIVENPASIQLLNDRSEPRAKLLLGLNIRGIDKNGQYFMEAIQTEDVSRHGLCFFTSHNEIEVNSVIELIGFQGKFNAQGEVRYIAYNATNKNYRIGVHLLGEPNNWVVK
jgi:hypothetical protein